MNLYSMQSWVHYHSSFYILTKYFFVICFPVILISSLLLPSCSSSFSISSNLFTNRQIYITGDVKYEIQIHDNKNGTFTTKLMPARFIPLEFFDENGTNLAITKTDIEGRYKVKLKNKAQKIVASSKIYSSDFSLAVVKDSQGGKWYKIEKNLEEVGSSFFVRKIGDESNAGGAFFILDTMLEALLFHRKISNAKLPPVLAIWSGNQSSVTSYLGKLRQESEDRFINLHANFSGGKQTYYEEKYIKTDILHEMGHFILEETTTKSSIGGPYFADLEVYPGLAWEEGRASWFASAVLGDPIQYYNLRNNNGDKRPSVQNLESCNNGGSKLERCADYPFGNGSYFFVAKVLWDLSDGIEGVSDSDEDGVSIGHHGVVNAMEKLSEVEGVYPCLRTYLQYLVSTGKIKRSDMEGMLSTTVSDVNEMRLYESDPSWPIDIELSKTIKGTIGAYGTGVKSMDSFISSSKRSSLDIDSQGEFAGIIRNLEDYVRVYRIYIPRRSVISIVLEVHRKEGGEGREKMGMRLATVNSEIIAETRASAFLNKIVKAVDVGWYVIYVNDDGIGGNIDFELEVEEL